MLYSTYFLPSQTSNPLSDLNATSTGTSNRQPKPQTPNPRQNADHERTWRDLRPLNHGMARLVESARAITFECGDTIIHEGNRFRSRTPNLTPTTRHRMPNASIPALPSSETFPEL